MLRFHVDFVKVDASFPRTIRDSCARSPNELSSAKGNHMIRVPTEILRSVARLCIERSRLSSRKIARACDCSAGTAQKIRDHVVSTNLTLEKIQEADDAALVLALFGEPKALAPRSPCPDWEDVHNQMEQPEATLTCIWEDWKEITPKAISYPHFARLYRHWLKRRSLTLRKIHRAGVNTFVDYAGGTVDIHLPDGTVRQACAFIAVLGASNYTFARLSWTQSVPDWIDSNNRMLAFFGGVTEFVVPDNLKSAVIHAGLKRLQLNKHYREWADHNKTVVLPARVRKPKDKATAEVGVQIAQRHILWRLRKRRWHSLEEANAELLILLEKLNARPFAKMPGSRLQRFLEVDKPALKPLPATTYEPCELKFSRCVGSDYHVEHDGNHYSVPHALAHTTVDMRVTRTVVEILQGGRRVCSHERCQYTNQRITIEQHMPDAHRHFVNGEPSALTDWARRTGTSTSTVIDGWLVPGSHFYQGLIMARGLRIEGDAFGASRIESACRLSLEIKSTTLNGIRTILRTGSDLRPLKKPEPPRVIDHSNIRGADYYATSQD